MCLAVVCWQWCAAVCYCVLVDVDVSVDVVFVVVGVAGVDIVVVPYVAIDSLGARLGYGGGYYDKAFAKSGCNKLTPFVCGLGYDYQQVDGTFGEIHDLKLKHVFTETSYFKYE